MPQRLRRLRAAFLADGRETTILALLALALFTAFYLWRLTAFLVNDDEGSYLYAAWRISLGELPYRDFLTPQLPGFLLPGGWLMRWAGPDVWPLRAMAAAGTLLAGVFTWKTARRLFGPAVAAGAAALFLLQPMSFLFGRIFRSEPFMLAWAGLAVYAFVRAYPSLGRDAANRSEGSGRAGWLLLSGVAFGLAFLCKLFGILPLAGCLLWLLLDGRREGRPWSRIVRDGLIVGGSAAVVVGVVMAYFATLAPNLEQAVLEHHLMQQSAKTRWSSLVQSLWFYYEFLEADQGGLLLVGALAMALAAWRARDRRALLLGCQLATLLGFVVLQRDLFVRHVMVLMPVMATLACAWAAGLRSRPEPADATTAERATRLVPLLMLLAFGATWLARDVSEGGRIEVATVKMGDLIRLSTGPDELVYGDFSELNFYSRRPTTYSAASMSAGAAKSGQIRWEVVQAELDKLGRVPALIAEVDTATDPGHLVHQPDYAAYAAWRDERYDVLGPFHRDFQKFTLYAPKDGPPAYLGDFARGPKLLGAEPMAASARAGDLVEVATAWQGPEVPDAEYVVTVRLVDRAGREWAQSDTSLFADDPDDDRKSFAWEARELIGQRVPLRLPGDLPPGPYRVEVGSYVRDAEAVMLLDREGNPNPGRAFAGEIEVGQGEGLEIPEGAAVGARFDDGPVGLPGDGRLTLLGRGPLPTNPVAAGGSFPLAVWWRAERQYPYWAHALRVAFKPGAPDVGVGTGQYFELVAPGGDIMDVRLPLTWRQQLHVPVPKELPPGEQALTLEFTDAGRGVDEVDLGTIRIGPADRVAVAEAAPTPAVSSASRRRLVFEDPQETDPSGQAYPAPPPAFAPGTPPRFGGLADVREGWIEPAMARAGDALTVTTRLAALSATPIPYWSTVQLLDDGDRPVAQSDGPLGAWARPSDTWVVGDRVDVLHALALQADLAPGNYTLAMAIYNPQSGWRLQVRGPGGRGDMLRLGSLHIAAGAAPRP